MTSKRSLPEQKAASKKAVGGKAEESAGPGAMDRFRRMAKAVVTAPREEIVRAEKTLKKKRD